MWMLASLFQNSKLSLMLRICTSIAAYTGLLFHAAVCIKPLVYRRIAGEVSEETAHSAMDAVDRYPKIPSLISAACLMIGTTAVVVTAILSGALLVPKIFILFNPVGTLLPLLAARKLNVNLPRLQSWEVHTFIDALHTMNLDRLIEIKQTAYDAYLGA